MNEDKSDKSGSWLGNPMPIVMVVLLAAGVLVKNVPLESARPTDPERVRSEPTSQQDVEARLWQDPFAAVEKYEEGSRQTTPHTPEFLGADIMTKREVTVVAVSIFGGSFNEAAESRRRTRFAVVSALGFHNYHPENPEALSYFHIDTPEPKSIIKLTVPYEWFKTRDELSNVLVLWLNESKLGTEPFVILQTLFKRLTQDRPTNSNNPAHRQAHRTGGVGSAEEPYLRYQVQDPPET